MSAPPPVPAKQVELATQVAASGRQVYLAMCSACHGPNGEGIPHVSVPMRTNSSLRLTSSRNFLYTVLHGIPEQQFPGLERMQPMPAFANKLTDSQVADLANWLRATWGGQPADVTAQSVTYLRSRVR